MGPAVRIGVSLSALALCAGVAAAWLQPRGERGHVPAVGMTVGELPPPNWVAIGAESTERRDERRSGLILRHQALHMNEVERPTSLRSLGAGHVLIYASAPELRQKVDDVLDGRIPLSRGLEATFAIGRLVPADIVRLGPDGRVREIETVRVTFVAFTIP